MAATPDFRLRFVGRFVFAKTGGSQPSELVAVAMNMGFNSHVKSDPHHIYITVPREFVQTDASSFATLSTFVPSPDGHAGAELFIWDAEDAEVTISGVRAEPLTLEAWDTVPDLGKLTNGGLLDAKLLRGAVRAGGPVAARFHFTAGRALAVQFDAGKRVSFEPMDERAPQGPHKDPLPDAVEIDLFRQDNTTPLSLTLVGRDGAERSIVVARRTADSDPPVVIGITNLCVHRGSTRLDDREFAAYYDLMEAPPASRERLVPYAAATPMEGARADCTGVAGGDF